jgi:hypothetical protein
MDHHHPLVEATRSHITAAAKPAIASAQTHPVSRGSSCVSTSTVLSLP